MFNHGGRDVKLAGAFNVVRGPAAKTVKLLYEHGASFGVRRSLLVLATVYLDLPIEYSSVC